MEVKQISRDNWIVEVTNEDRKKIASITERFKAKIEMPQYGKWKSMSSEDLWEELLGQFCVMGSARPIEKLKAYPKRYSEFLKKLSIETLSSVGLNQEEYVAAQLKEYKATRFHNKTARRIISCLQNQEIVKDEKIVFLEDWKNQEALNEDFMRNLLLNRLHFFKIKSISDLMITIGAARDIIAFDTRVVGLLNKHFGLNVRRDKIQSNTILYKLIERKLRDVCRDLGIELSLLDRILFRFNSAIECLLETECV
jgi:thermostable 8-oxoguanine DNA glycosylase